MKRIILGNRCDLCAFTVFFCLMMMFLFQNLALAQEHGQNQNPLLNWREDGRNPDDFEVLSLLPSGNAATEVDDGDGKTRTKTFIVPVTANATLTVVATPKPDTTEENLPDEWTLTGGTGIGKLSRTVSLAEPAKFVLNCKCGKSEKETTIYVFSMNFVTPAGDPTTSAGAKDSGDGQNEFTYSSANTGTLTINLSVQVNPSEAAERIMNLCTYSVEDIIGSTLIWDAANPDGKATVSSNGRLTAIANFIGLPALNSSFGKKTAAITCSMSSIPYVVQQDYEVFFPRDANNHPSNSNNANQKNWYFYWMQHAPGMNVTINQSSVNINVTYSTSTPPRRNAWGKACGMTDWSYTSAPQKNEIIIYSNNLPAKGKAYGIGKEYSGIDHFYNLLRHEKHHVYQIYLCDAILTNEVNTCFRYGWSFNQTITNHNHWSKGSDGAWGNANVDDDLDNIVDNAKITPPFEPGHGDDVLLSHTSGWAKDWPLFYNLPTNPQTDFAIEDDAIMHSEAEFENNRYSSLDWGCPGKNHRHSTDWND